MILDGKKIAGEILQDLQEEISSLDTQPILGAILVGSHDSPSLRYIHQKQKACKQAGIGFSLFQFSQDISQLELEEEISKLNSDNSISGYIVQLPLPPHIESFDIIKKIHPAKDVDGFHPINQGKLMVGDKTGFIPCTPAGVMKILKAYNIELRGKKVVIIGRSNIVGKPLSVLCINAGATVISCNSHTKDISHYTKDADIIMTATGQPSILTASMISSSSVIIDVGFSVVEGHITGDASYQAILSQGNMITPVPGGVGPMTVAMLLNNTLKAHKQNIGH